MELNDDYNYIKYYAINVVDQSSIPTVGKYAVTLLVYLLLIGPPLYFLLKKLDKRGFIWLVVPVLSVLFGSFIYGIGGTTRQDKPSIGYLTIDRIEGETVKSHTFFGVTVPYNDDYELTFSKDWEISMDSQTNYYFSSSASQEEAKKNISVGYDADVARVSIEDCSAFSTICFAGEMEKKAEGAVKSNLDFTEFTPKGEVTNNLGYELKQAALYLYGNLYPIGDLGEGEGFSPEGSSCYQLLTKTPEYGGLLETLSGANPYVSLRESTTTSLRWYYSYEYIMTQLAPTGCYLIGFCENAQNEELEATGLSVDGAQMIVATVDVKLNRDKTTYIPNIDQYIQEMDGTYSSNDNRMIYENVEIEYQFDKEDRILQLVYTGCLNPEFNEENLFQNGFYGEVLAYNYTTRTYDVLFTNEGEGSVSAEDYLGEDNRMKLSLEVERSQIQEYGWMPRPVISAVKEGK
jgi:hypothetical protein